MKYIFLRCLCERESESEGVRKSEERLNCVGGSEEGVRGVGVSEEFGNVGDCNRMTGSG